MRRKNNISKYVKKLCLKKKWRHTIREVDLLLHGDADDILVDQTWIPLRDSLRAGEWDTLVVTPPCSDFSRVKWANSKGPKPTRSRQHPRGFPWLKGRLRNSTDKANELVDKSIEACKEGHASSARTSWLAEHPEDLGDTPQGGCPASIWQWESMHELIKSHDAVQGAPHQGVHPEALSSKPTRLAGTVRSIAKLLALGPPKFNKDMQ